MHSTTWRMKRSSSILLTLFAIAAGGASLVMLLAGLDAGEPLGAIVVAGLMGLPAVAAVVAMRRLRLVADDAGVLVVNIRKTHRVRWDEIAGATAGYHGIEIHLRGGGSVLSSVAQKANLSTWRGARTRADEIAEAISARAAAGGDRPFGTPPP